MGMNVEICNEYCPDMGQVQGALQFGSLTRFLGLVRGVALYSLLQYPDRLLGPLQPPILWVQGLLPRK
jgi:hypothetical protein